MAIPLLLAVTLGLVWLLALATAQVRMVDATREAARAVARGDSTDEALERSRLVDGVGGLFDALPSVDLTADAVAAREDPPP